MCLGGWPGNMALAYAFQDDSSGVVLVSARPVASCILSKLLFGAYASENGSHTSLIIPDSLCGCSGNRLNR